MIAAADQPAIKATKRRTPEEQLDYLRNTISASRLGLFLQCRLKFHFRYIAQIQKPTTPSMHAGATVHAVLQGWNMARWRREPFDPKLSRYRLKPIWPGMACPPWLGSSIWFVPADGSLILSWSEKHPTPSRSPIPTRRNWPVTPSPTGMRPVTRNRAWSCITWCEPRLRS
jgi:hypothetical protein